jgi:biopolymer transport protein ExbB
LSSVELFQKGGPVMYLLLLCSLSVMAIAIDRFMLYKRAGKGSKELLHKLMTDWHIVNLKSMVKEKDDVVSLLVKTGIEAKDADLDIRMALDTTYSEAALQLRARLNYLSMVITMAPLLGLLGTISGMIQSFSIFNAQAGQPLAITGGIGEALIATATGLCVAIFALVIHTYFSQRMDQILTTMEKTDNIVMANLVKRGGVSNEA